MLRLPSFTYVPARTADEAVELLAAHGADALPVSGGTDLYANMKQRLFTPKVVVGLRPIASLHFIRYNDVTGLTLGALASLSEIAQSGPVRRHYPALAAAAASVSTPQLRNMGTIGGNVCVDTRCNYYNQNLDWRKALGYCMKKDGDVCRVATSSPRCLAVNSSDTAPVLQVYGARIHLAGPGGEREIPIEEFYLNDGMRAWAKQHSEIVTRISIPPPGERTRSAYRKLRLRNSFDFPILGVAALVRVNPAGECVHARLVLNAVAPKPLEVPAAAQALIGTRLDDAALDAGADAAFDAGKPLDNTSGTIP
ncbi:MAG: FAD binding domain-containing protein, partial [Candidatus Eremiobacteraeota bacterium]|nr:FAD binding domain-containing protein [Candidatus Eremiobacteraeota bacterium]